MTATVASPSLGTTAFGLLLEIRPFPMVGVLVATLLASVMAESRPDPAQLLLFLLAVLLVLYSAHLRDTLVDRCQRREDADSPDTLWDAGSRVSARALAGALVLSSTGAIALLLLLAVIADPLLLVIGLAGYGIAIGYAPFLDIRPVTVSISYPAGVALAMAGAYLLGAGTLDVRFLAVAGPVAVYLAGAKIVSDILDLEGDRRMGKRTAASVLGEASARRLGYGLCTVALALFAAGAGTLVPAGALFAPIAAAPLVALSSRTREVPAVLLLVAGAYAALAVLGAAFIGLLHLP